VARSCGDGEIKQKKTLLAVVVLQSPHLLEPVVAHDGGSGEAVGLQHNHSHHGTHFGLF
jgi:hypothetical protein